MLAKLNFVSYLQNALVADPIVLENLVAQVPRIVKNAHFSFVHPETTPGSKLISISRDCAHECLDISSVDLQEFEDVLSGNKAISENTKSWSLAYGGHQFGSYAGQLGDGRAISLAQIRNSKSQIWEIQLKGAGMTPYSRSADGYAVLRSSIREYLASEAMHHLGIPTSRSLSLIATSQIVYRETPEKGAIVSRLAPSWIRFGSFELFFYRNDVENLKKLADYTIKYFFPQFESNVQKYSDWFADVCDKTALMIANWQAYGFCHGVLNTDNFSILGLTIDYGPYQFMDIYDPSYICNHSDESGLYSFDNQPRAAQFNLMKLATAIVPLVLEQERNDRGKVQMLLSGHLENFMPTMERIYMARMHKKLGLEGCHQEDVVNNLLQALYESKADYTLFFRALSTYESSSAQSIIATLELKNAKPLLEWFEQSYDVALNSQSISNADRHIAMLKVNPRYVLRNGHVQKVIDECEKGLFSGVDEYLAVLAKPFEDGTAKQQSRFGGLVDASMLGLRCSCSS